MTLPAPRPRRPLRPYGWREPFREFEDIFDRMSRLMEATFGETSRWGELAWSPAVDVEETDDAYVVEAELPGIRQEDVSVELQDNGLVITGEIKEKEERKGTVREQTRRTGRFYYRTSLPGGVDADRIEAKLDQGVLTVRVPKTERAKGRKIEITGG